MAFWSNLFSQSSALQKQQKLTDLIKILDQELLPCLQKDPPENSTKIWKKILQHFDIAHISPILYTKIPQWENPCLLKLTEVMVLCQQEPQFIAFLKHNQITSSQDRNLIWIGRLLHFYRKKTLNKELLPILEEIVTKAIGEQAAHALLNILHDKIPHPISDISLIRGTITTPLFSTLSRLLVHHHLEVRRNVVLMLGGVSDKNEQVIPLLVKTLQDPKASVCKAAANTLIKFGIAILPFLDKSLDQTTLPMHAKISIAWLVGHWAKKNTDLAPKLIVHLQNPNPSLQETLIQTLSKMGETILPLLWKQLEQSQDEPVLVGIAKIIARIKPPITPEIHNFLMSLLKHTSPHVRIAAIETLGQTLQLTLDMTKAILQDNDLNVKIAILQEINRRHIGNPDLLDIILPLAQSSDSNNLREAAILALGESGIASPKLIPMLLGFLDDPNIAIQKAAVFALGTQDNENAIDIFNQLLRKITPQTSEEFILAVIAASGKLSCASDIAIPWLQQFLNETKAPLAIAALKALAELGPASEPLFPLLLQKLQQRNPKLQTYIGEVLVKIGPSVAPRLLEMANQSPVELKSDIIDVLTKFGMEIKMDLVAGLTGPSASKRQVAVDVLGKLGEPAFSTLLTAASYGDFWIHKAVSRAFEKNGKTAVNYLINLLLQPIEPEISTIAIDALKKMKQKSLVQLLPYLGHQNLRISQLALQAVKQAGPEYQECISELLKLLEHPSSMTRRAAIWCLEKIQVSNPTILHALQKAQDTDEDPQVRQQATQSITGLLNAQEMGESHAEKMQD